MILWFIMKSHDQRLTCLNRFDKFYTENINIFKFSHRIKTSYMEIILGYDQFA